MRYSFTFSIKRLIAAGLITTAMSVSAGQIREVPAFDLPDTSIATYDQFGPVIYYNPLALQRLGPQVSKFVRAHEYAHHILHHIQRGDMAGWQTNTAQTRRSFELEADCYAAKNVSRAVAQAAADSFSQTQGVERPDAQHPTGNERATVIKQCAGIAL